MQSDPEKALVSALLYLKSASWPSGVTIVKECFSVEALLAARDAAKAALETDVLPQVPMGMGDKLSTLEEYLSKPETYWPAGIVGNRNFGYLIAQPELKKDAPSLQLSSGMEISMAMGSSFRANIALLSHPSSKKALEILFSYKRPQGDGGRVRVVSQDFCKLFRGDLTPPHVDIYSSDERELNRIQAMGIGLREGSVKLCYLQFSHLPEIRELVTAIVGKNIYGDTGFQRVPEKKKDGGNGTDPCGVLIDCFLKAGCIVHGEPRDLVIWDSGVIHLEMQRKRDGSLVFRNDKKTTTERYIVGVHDIPDGNFSQQDLIEIGYAAEKGFVFHPYHNLNAGTPAGKNSVHRKKTQYLHFRARSEDEKNRFQNLQKDIETESPVGDWLSGLSPEKKLCFGIK